MGNTIKNYQKKQRKEYKNAYREVRNTVHDTIIQKMNLPKSLVDKEKEIFDLLK